MDELEFRRRIYANPADSDEALLTAAKSNDDYQSFWQDIKGLDEQIKTAAHVSVPEDLANKLVWQQTMRQFNRQKRRTRWYIGLAASVAFTVGIVFTGWQQQQVELGQAALAHMHYAETEQPRSGEVTSQLVNAKLAQFGAQLDPTIGKIASANYCHLDAVRSLHLIIETVQGRMSVFLVPETDNFINNDFNDENYKGSGYLQAHTNILVVGENGADIPEFKSKLKERLRFSA